MADVYVDPLPHVRSLLFFWTWLQCQHKNSAYLVFSLDVSSSRHCWSLLCNVSMMSSASIISPTMSIQNRHSMLPLWMHPCRPRSRRTPLWRKWSISWWSNGGAGTSHLPSTLANVSRVNARTLSAVETMRYSSPQLCLVWLVVWWPSWESSCHVWSTIWEVGEVMAKLRMVSCEEEKDG